MDNSASVKVSDEAVDAARALEAGVRVIARMIIKAVVTELCQQEKYFNASAIGPQKDAPVAAAAAAKQPANNLVCTVEEAGKLLGVSRSTAYECARTGQIPSIKYGKRILIPRAALMKLLDDVGSFKPQQDSSIS